MPFQPAQPMSPVNQGQLAVVPNGRVRKLRGTEPAGTVAIKRLQAQIHLLCEQGHIKAGACAASCSRIVECADRRWTGKYRARGAYASRGVDWRGTRCKYHCASGIRSCWSHYRARIHTVAERARDAEHFVMAPSRIERGL